MARLKGWGDLTDLPPRLSDEMAKQEINMQRENWNFTYTAAQLAKAATQKILYHEECLKVWVARRTSVIATIRSDGIEVDESALQFINNPKARDWDLPTEVMVRNDLRKELTDCTRKLAYHTERRDTFDGWRQALQANPDCSHALDIDDWLFFFGRDVGRDNQR